MRSVSVLFLAILALSGVLVSAAPVSAQGFGLGGRFAWVTRDIDVEDDQVRFYGGQMRVLSRRWGLEVSLDRRAESFELLNQEVTETPIQASVLLRLGSARATPFLLGGPGWYKREVKALDGPEDLGVSSTEFGWHAGGGLEIRITRHLGIHGDYRYTFLDFGDDEEGEDEGFIGGLLPGHRGSMWTLGATFYF